jgi:iron complex transport system substrate-binding protein
MNKKVIAIVLTFMLALSGALLAGCSGGGAGSDAEPAPIPAPKEEIREDSAIVVTDMAGREVMLDAPAERIVALTAADVEILYAIGAGDTLVGRGEYCNYPPEALDVQSVQSGYETNIEQIIGLEPDLLIMATMDQSEDQVRQCEDAGIPVFVTDAQDIEGAYTAIGLLGRLVGKEAEAAAVVKDMKDIFADLSAQAAAAGDEQKTVYFEVSPLEYGLWTTGKDTFMNEVAELLGMKNIFDDVTGWAEISEEQVLERNPDYILTVGMYFGEGPTPIESILARPGWESITAIQNEAIINLTADELSRPGPRLALGAQILYDFVYN